MLDHLLKYIRVVGSIIVVAGIYGFFLWGKKMETSAEDIEVNKELSKSDDLELQLSNSNNDQN